MSRQPLSLIPREHAESWNFYLHDLVDALLLVVGMAAQEVVLRIDQFELLAFKLDARLDRVLAGCDVLEDFPSSHHGRLRLFGLQPEHAIVNVKSSAIRMNTD